MITIEVNTKELLFFANYIYNGSYKNNIILMNTENRKYFDKKRFSII